MQYLKVILADDLTDEEGEDVLVEIERHFPTTVQRVERYTVTKDGD
jgi:hypothetical protein